jgi:hypothetical protein
MVLVVLVVLPGEEVFTIVLIYSYILTLIGLNLRLVQDAFMFLLKIDQKLVIMKKNYLFLFVIMLAFSCNTNDDSRTEKGQLNGKLGVWEGVGTQPGFSWTIKITLDSNKQLIEYPSLVCGGFLTLISKTETQLLFRETITLNTEVCLDQGFVELIETSETTMDYNYFYPNSTNEKGELGAFGSVTKVE